MSIKSVLYLYRIRKSITNLGLFLALGFIVASFASTAYGEGPPTYSPAESEEQTPVKSFEPGGNSTSAPQNSLPAFQEAGSTSLDFMMDESPLRTSSPAVVPEISKNGIEGTVPPKQVLPPETSSPPEQLREIDPIVETGRILEKLRATSQETEHVAMLVSEACDQKGGGEDGTVSCKRTYSNGNHALSITQRASGGDETKVQSVTKEYDQDGNLLYTKTIRQRTDYNYVDDRRYKEKELLDIVYQPRGRKTTRELMIFQYDLPSGKVTSMSWTQYRQIGHQPKAGLVYHAALRYDSEGKPIRGVAEQWDHGKKVADFLNWSAVRQGRFGLDQENWHNWESWIKNVSIQAYLP